MASSLVQRPKTAEGLAWEESCNPTSNIPQGEAMSGSAKRRTFTPPPVARPSPASKSLTKAAPTMATNGRTTAASAFAATTLRAGFVRKVYGILAAQMAVTVVVAAACTLNVSAQNLVLKMVTKTYSGWLVFIPTVVCLSGLHVKKNVYPWNYYLLFGLTFSISFNVGAVCAVLSGVGLAWTILQAAGITLSIFVGLSAYAFCCKRDFSFLKAFLSFSLWGLVVAGLASFFIGSSLLEAALAWFGAILFCAYIVYDTQKLATKSGYDDYIIVAAEIYLDIVNLFMYIVKLLVKDKERKS